MNGMFKKWFENYKREIVVGLSVALSVGFMGLLKQETLKNEIRELQVQNEEQQSKISSLEMTEKSLRNDKKYLQEKVDSADLWLELFTKEEREEIIKEKQEENEKIKQEKEEEERKKKEEERLAKEQEEKEEQERLAKQQEQQEKESKKDKLEKARDTIDGMAKDTLTNYKVIVQNDMVILMQYAQFTSSDTMEDWNYLVEVVKEVSINLKGYIDDDVRFVIMVGASDNNVTLAVENGIVYYDYYNGIDKLGMNDGSYGL